MSRASKSRWTRSGALPQLEGPRLPDIPSDKHGLVPLYNIQLGARSHRCLCRRRAWPRLAASTGEGSRRRRADAAASSIAADAGANVKPKHSDRSCVGLLITRLAPQVLRAGPPASARWSTRSHCGGRRPGGGPLLTHSSPPSSDWPETARRPPLHEGAIPDRSGLRDHGRPAWTRV